VSRLLVTGGAGFIGSHLVDRLLSDGHQIVALDNLSTGERARVPEEAEFVEGDVRNADDIRAAARGVEGILHLAGQASVFRAYEAPENDLATNVLGTLNALEAAIALGVPRFIYASSMTVYGDVDVPTPEDAPTRPRSYYGVTKLAGERYVHAAGAREDVDLAVTSFRMFNVYGPRQSLTNPYQGVLAIFVGNALRDEAIAIHGDGEQTRDFVYIDDVVEAWVRALAEPATRNAVFNLGAGRETTVNELVDAVLAAFDRSREASQVRHEPRRPGDPLRAQGDKRALADALDWQARVPLEDGMRRTIDWARGG
jgi:UDP-glucose 4-epimerase